MAAIVSAQTGLASDTLTWVGGVVPVLGDSVDVLVTHNVTLDGTYHWGDDTSTAIRIFGTLSSSRIVDSELSSRGQLTIEDGGVLDRGTELSPIPQTITTNLRLNSSSVLVAGKWGLTCTDLGVYSCNGYTKTTNSFLTADVLATETVCDIDDVTNWEIGDKIIFGTTAAGNTGAQFSETFITNIVANTVTVFPAFANSHTTLGRVSNFTRNVKVTSFDTSFVGYQNLLVSSSTVPNSRYIKSLECTFLGHNTTNTVLSASLRLRADSGQIDAYEVVQDLVMLDFNGEGIQFNNGTVLGVTDVALFDRTAIRRTIAIFRSSTQEINNLTVIRAARGVFLTTGGGLSTRITNSWIVGCGTGVQKVQGLGLSLDTVVIASCNEGIRNSSGAGTFLLNNCDLGLVSGTYNGTLVTGILVFSTTIDQTILTDCGFVTSGVTIPNLSATPNTTEIRVVNRDRDVTQQEKHNSKGIIFRESVVVNQGDSSLRAEPNNTGQQLIQEWNIIAPNNAPVSVSGFIRKNSLYGSSTLPRVTLSGLGITESVFTMPDIDDDWVQFVVSGTQSTGFSGAFTLQAIFETANSGGLGYVDTIVAPSIVAVDTGSLSFWSNGSPVELISSNIVSAQQLWEIQTSALTSAGSIGAFVKKLLSVSKFLGLK